MPTEPSCLFDTGVVIAYLRNLSEAVISLLSHLVEKGPLAVSAITVLEVWQGARETEIKATRAFFDGARVIALDQFLAEKAGLLVQQLRRSGITISPRCIYCRHRYEARNPYPNYQLQALCPSTPPAGMGSQR